MYRVITRLNDGCVSYPVTSVLLVVEVLLKAEQKCIEVWEIVVWM